MFNVIFVDWSDGAYSIYKTSKNNAIKTGKKVADFVNSTGISPMDVHCIGHSLGAHVTFKYLKNINDCF